MIIGTVKEIKDNENRVGLTPEGVKKLIENKHEVLVEHNSGICTGFNDKDYEEAGAKITNKESIFRKADLIIKVKEPVKEEYSLLGLFKGKTLFTYFHLSGVDKELTKKLLENKITAIAYETVEKDNELPLLKPMSEVAGTLAVQYGAQYLQKKYGGLGITLGKIKNADTANVLIVGAGTVGTASAKVAAGMGSNVFLFDINQERLDSLKQDLKFKNLKFIISNEENLKKYIRKTNLLIGAVLVTGAKAPPVITKEMVKSMKKGSVIVDVAIDQGGCIYGVKPTSHSNPIYEFEDKIYCCVTNMPGQVPFQSTQALTNSTLPYLLEMSKDILEALRNDPGFMKGLNTHNGKITYKSIAQDLDMMECFEEFK